MVAHGQFVGPRTVNTALVMASTGIHRNALAVNAEGVFRISSACRISTPRNLPAVGSQESTDLIHDGLAKTGSGTSGKIS